jgi:hypothetical protein
VAVVFLWCKSPELEDDRARKWRHRLAWGGGDGEGEKDSQLNVAHRTKVGRRAIPRILICLTYSQGEG